MKKAIILIVGCLLIILNLFGCVQKSSQPDSDKITIVAPLNGISEPRKDNNIEEGIKELTGESISTTWVPKESYKDKTMMMMAAGDYPDILVVENETEDIVKGVEQGGFWNIGSYLKDYTNLSQADKNILENSSFNGEIYGLYRYRNSVDNAIVLRKDWLKKLGLKNPTTADEFKNVLKEFTYNDPDGNGVDDTYGLSISGTNYDSFNLILEQVAAWFGAPNGWKDEDGKLIPSFMTNEYKEALEYIRNLYSEGLIDNNLYSTSSFDVEKNFENSKFGAIIEKKTAILKLESEMSKKNQGNSSEFMTTIAGVKGSSEGKILSNSGYSGLLMFPRKGIKTEEKLKRVLSFLDKLNSEEGYILLNYGLEGENYNKENGIIKTKITVDNYNLTSYLEINTNCKKEYIKNEDDNKFINELNTALNIPEKDKSINPTEAIKIQGHIKNQDKLQEKINQLNAKYIFGEINRDEYEDGLNEWMASGGEDYIEKVNDLYKKYVNK